MKKFIIFVIIILTSAYATFLITIGIPRVKQAGNDWREFVSAHLEDIEEPERYISNPYSYTPPTSVSIPLRGKTDFLDSEEEQKVEENITEQEEKEVITPVQPESDYIFKKPYEVVGQLFSSYSVYSRSGKVLDYQIVLVKKWTTKNGLIYGTISTTFDEEGNATKEVHEKLEPL